jgi:cation transport ATPase
MPKRTGPGAVDEREWLGLAAALERRALHPIAQSLQAHVEARWPNATSRALEAGHVDVVPGRGVSGGVNGHRIVVGNRRMLEEYGVPLDSGADAESPGPLSTEVWVARDGALLGCIEPIDPLRPNAREVVRSL